MGGGDFDAVSIHPYGDPLHWAAVHDTHDATKHYRDGRKPAWINDYGWSDSKGNGPVEKLENGLSTLARLTYNSVQLVNYPC